MKRELRITDQPIDESSLLRSRELGTGNGAVIHFLGVVRGVEGEDRIEALDYECFREMAEHQFHLIFDQAAQKWPVRSVRLIHRIGVVPVGEPSLWVEVIAGHRGEAFAACQWLIDEMKQKVPIWKRAVPANQAAVEGFRGQ